MRLLKGNLLSGKPGLTPPPSAGKPRTAFLYSPILFVVIFAVSFLFGRASLSETGVAVVETLEHIPVIGGVHHLLRSPDRKLDGETDGTINVLLMGMGGEGHDGPYLTDTMILASIRPAENTVALLSIPRDLLVPVEGSGWRKVNAVNAFGEVAQRGRGGELARKTVESLLGVDIPYYIRVDFAGFQRVIDGVGGVDIYVERSFTDRSYPTDNYGYQTVTFSEGWQHMDGATALIYARSRHGNNGEGSDFARAKRQQNVIDVLKDKLLSVRTYRNPAVVSDTLSTLQSHIATNVSIGELLRFARMAQQMDDITFLRKVIDIGPNSPLVEANVNGAYVLIPKNNDWTLLRGAVANMFEDATPSAAAAAPPKPVVAETAGTAEIRNGSGEPGVARDVATRLTSAGVEVTRIGNADSFNYTTSTIYDLTGGRGSATLAKITATLPGATVATRVPAAVAASAGAGIDFVLIIGKNR